MSIKKTIEPDLKFLKEIRERLNIGINEHDPTQTEFALRMIDDWIDELTGSK